ncbi:MAG: hypothetical protein VB041_11020, partial [Candidatus Limiplasma sp.]|nr:hypothetical protein [Candidatus Limiplasma sp.]
KTEPHPFVRAAVIVRNCGTCGKQNPEYCFLAIPPSMFQPENIVGWNGAPRKWNIGSIFQHINTNCDVLLYFSPFDIRRRQSVYRIYFYLEINVAYSF